MNISLYDIQYPDDYGISIDDIVSEQQMTYADEGDSNKPEVEIWKSPTTDDYFLKIRIRGTTSDGVSWKRGAIFKITSEYLENMPSVAEGWTYPIHTCPSKGLQPIYRKDSKDAPVPEDNNDGRDTCYSCGAPTKVVGFFNNMRVCTKCGK